MAARVGAIVIAPKVGNSLSSCELEKLAPPNEMGFAGMRELCALPSEFEENIERNLYAHHQHAYGILVAIPHEDNDRHHLPHIHVRHSGMKASITIEDGCALESKIPAMQKIEALLLGGAS